METVPSADGTEIAFDVEGSGTPLVIVCGAFADRQAPAGLARELSSDFKVANYDRRGRGDSTDTQPYAVERELEDLAAVIDAVGSPAVALGFSSGAGLALLAAAAGLPISAVIAFEPPYRSSPGAPVAPDDALEHQRGLIADDRRGDAVAYFMHRLVGLPQEAVDGAKQNDAMWAALGRVAPTTVYDLTLMGDNQVPAALASIAVPTLTLDSTGSPDWLRDAARDAAAAVPGAQHQSLDGAYHQLPDEILAPAVTAFVREAVASA